MNSELYLLFEKYLYAQLSKEEVVRLKRLVEEADDDTIEDNLSMLWEKYEKTENCNREFFSAISQNLRKLRLPRKSFVNYRLIMRAAASLFIPVLIAAGVYYYTKQQSYRSFASTAYKVITEKGERASVILPDGSKVSLNSETSLSYPATFGKNDRHVKLAGEAYFEIKTNESLPFIVETERIKIKVLGTVFNVYAYSGAEYLETSLIKGNVELSTNNGTQIIKLKPNQVAHYSFHTERFAVNETDLRFETAWKRGDLMFRSDSIQNVLRQIDIFYGSTTEIEGNYPTQLFTGTFHESDINQVLKNLQQHFNFIYRKNGNNIYIQFNNKH